MIVERDFQKTSYPLEKLNECGLPVVKLKHNFTETLTWDEIINISNKFIINGKVQKITESPGGETRMYYKINEVTSKIKKVAPIEKSIREIFPKNKHDTIMFGSFENFTGGLGLHKDNEATILHIQKGEVIVNVVVGEISHVFDLKENDMIYIQKQISHCVIGLTPRFLVSYGIHDQ